MFPISLQPVIPSEITRVREDDIQQHLEDDILVCAIRNGQSVSVYWSQLTADEKRAAYQNVYNPCNLPA